MLLPRCSLSTTTHPTACRRWARAWGCICSGIGPDVGSGDATTTKPSSGYFVAVKSNENTGTITATPSITTAGYGTSANHALTGATATVGASASDETYIVVQSGSASTPATTITKNPTISVNASGLITASYSGSQSITPTVSAGYVTAGTAGTVSTSGSST